MDDSSFMIYVGLGEDVLRQKRVGRKERKKQIAQSRFPLRESRRLGDLELLRPLLPTGDRLRERLRDPAGGDLLGERLRDRDRPPPPPPPPLLGLNDRLRDRLRLRERRPRDHDLDRSLHARLPCTIPQNIAFPEESSPPLPAPLPLAANRTSRGSHVSGRQYHQDPRIANQGY